MFSNLSNTHEHVTNTHHVNQDSGGRETELARETSESLLFLHGF